VVQTAPSSSRSTLSAHRSRWARRATCRPRRVRGPRRARAAPRPTSAPEVGRGGSSSSRWSTPAMDEPWRRILTAPRAEELDQRCPVRGPHMEHAGAAVAEVELEQEHTGEHNRGGDRTIQRRPARWRSAKTDKQHHIVVDYALGGSREFDRTVRARTESERGRSRRADAASLSTCCRRCEGN